MTANEVADILGVTNRTCDGNHPLMGCDWEKCLEISRRFFAEREGCAAIAERDSIISWAGGSTGDAKGTALRIATAIREVNQA